MDGSEHSERASELAGSFARMSGGIVQVITAYEEIPGNLVEPNLLQVIAETACDAWKIIDKTSEEIG